MVGKRAVYAGIDWSTTKHDVCVVEVDGGVRGERCFDNTPKGLAELADWLAAQADEPSSVAVAIETTSGPVVDALMERQLQVFSINPKQLDRFRDRFSPAGAKDDRRDARVLADSVRTDKRAFRLLDPEEPTTIELRELARTAADLQNQKVAKVNQLRQLLRRYYPQALELTASLDLRWFLELLKAAPTPEAGRRLGRDRVKRILKKLGARRLTARDVLSILRKPGFAVADGTAEAVSYRVDLVRQQLVALVEQLREVKGRIDGCFAKIQAAEEEQEQGGGEQRDIEILLSLPGVGRTVLATLLAEANRLIASRDYNSLRVLGGVAPVTKQTGVKRGKRVGRRVVVRRYACNRRIGEALYHMARVASMTDAHWKALYQAQRERGATHGRACRGVADRMLAVAISMLRSQTPYDPSRLGKRDAA